MVNLSGPSLRPLEPLGRNDGISRRMARNLFEKDARNESVLSIRMTMTVFTLDSLV